MLPSSAAVLDGGATVEPLPYRSTSTKFGPREPRRAHTTAFPPFTVAAPRRVADFLFRRERNCAQAVCLLLTRRNEAVSRSKLADFSQETLFGNWRLEAADGAAARPFERF